MLSERYIADFEVEALALAFFERTLPKRAWTHRAHFSVALWVIVARPRVDPMLVIPPAIRRYNEATGVANTDTGGYHATITLASIRAARSFHAADPSRALYAACNAVCASPLGRSDWPLAYWSSARLFSVEARRRWCEPDLQDLPF